MFLFYVIYTLLQVLLLNYLINQVGARLIKKEYTITNLKNH